MISNRFRQIRKDAKMSSEKFAERLGVSRGVISNIEYNRVTEVKDLYIHLVCKEFNINEHWLRTGEGEPYNNSNEDIKFMRLLGELAADNNATIRNLIFKINKLNDKDLLAINTLVDSILKEDDESSN
ncbi:helix-turn-helix domain-containing protein [Bacillus thuringiensis]|uniref:helix-turn-helix domain-containing protein n=1 Tax=Bacillus thuringiensis TaxID=1428 RepID=UPI00333A4699